MGRASVADGIELITDHPEVLLSMLTHVRRDRMTSAHGLGEVCREVSKPLGDVYIETRQQSAMGRIIDAAAAAWARPERVRGAHPLPLVPTSAYRVRAGGCGDDAEMVFVFDIILYAIGPGGAAMTLNSHPKQLISEFG
jgi:hypothetical protein